MPTKIRKANLPPGYDPSKFPALAVTVDMVIDDIVDSVPVP